MEVLVYLSLECYGQSTDVIIKTKTRDRSSLLQKFCKKGIFTNIVKFTENFIKMQLYQREAPEQFFNKFCEVF